MRVHLTSKQRLRLLPLGRSLLILGLMGGGLLPADNAEAGRIVPIVSGLLQAQTAWAGNPKCFMHGIIVPLAGSGEKPSVSDMIRLHFDADNKAKCELMMKSYCRYNVKDKNYSPKRLKGSFKPDVSQSEEHSYEFTEKCELVADD